MTNHLKAKIEWLESINAELLGACEAAFDFLDGDERTLQQTINQLKQAIAKAEGE